MITFSYRRLPSNGNYVPLWSFCDQCESPLAVCKARLKCTTQNLSKQGWLTEVTRGHLDMMTWLRGSWGTSPCLKQPWYYKRLGCKKTADSGRLLITLLISGCVGILTSQMCNGSWECFRLLVWINWKPTSSDGVSITHFKHHTWPERLSLSFTSAFLGCQQAGNWWTCCIAVH